jgi:pimeloyl-ACP methyl ester carboxylesterase
MWPGLGSPGSATSCGRCAAPSRTWSRLGGPAGSSAVLAAPGTLAEFAAVTPPGSTWRNQLCARAVLAPPYRLTRKTGRIRCPILYCIATDDQINPPALGIEAAAGAAQSELRRYPGGHFAPLLGETFERVVVDQAEFLDRHLRRDAEQI